jgi:hypothetical protein
MASWGQASKGAVSVRPGHKDRRQPLTGAEALCCDATGGLKQKSFGVHTRGTDMRAPTKHEHIHVTS